MNKNIEQAKQYFDLGLNLFGLGDYAGAEEQFMRALSLCPDRLSILINLSATLIKLGKWSECEKVCQKILSVDSDNYDAHLNIGVCLSHYKNEVTALDHLNRAIAINPNLHSAWINKGNIFQESGNLEEAENCFNMALSLSPLSEEALIGRGNIRNDKKEYQQALEDFNAALSVNSSNAQAKWNKALSLLRLGIYDEGWKLYESRWEVAGMREHKKYLDLPLWLGKEQLRNKIILVYAEQGYGDVIQFARYLPLLEKMGAKVLFEVQGPLVDLMKTLSPSIYVFENFANTFVRSFPNIDYRCPVMSLPLAFSTTLETIPNNCPYLWAQETKSIFWQTRLEVASDVGVGNFHPFRIGIAWSGSGQYAGKKNIKRDLPSTDVSTLINCFHESTIEFHSLQIEASKNRALGSLVKGHFFTHGDLLQDFSDTAALMSQMDLIVSIDTAAAHLAGSLNLPTLLLIPDPPDFMVQISRTDTPWYPRTQIIRQNSPGSWPVAQIAEAIKQYTETK